MEKEVELVIIGGGPAGVSAGIYAARKKIKTLFVAEEFGGQSIVSENIQNWIGFPSISGIDLAKALKDHVYMYEGDDFIIHETTVVSVKKEGEANFVVTLKNNEVYRAKTLFIATGSSRRKLTIPGAAEFEHKGLTYCASCDGPLFSGFDTVVVGGGNAGFETAAQLLEYTKSVTLLHRGDKYKGDALTVDKVLSHPKMTGMLNVDITKINGDKLVSGIEYKNLKTGEEKSIDVKGVFVEIGLIPNTSLVADLVALDEYKRIKVNPHTQETSDAMIWAAGDATDGLFHQNNIASGDAIRGLEYLFLKLKTSF